MKDKILNWLFKNTMRIIILLGSIIVFIVVRDLYQDYQYRCKWKKEVKEMGIKGVSNSTRSFHPADTTKDTIK